jgi:hypothetical protein
LAGDILGFRLDCTDCEFGPAAALITHFRVVPEPITLALLGAGFAGIAVLRRRRLANT